MKSVLLQIFTLEGTVTSIHRGYITLHRAVWFRFLWCTPFIMTVSFTIGSFTTDGQLAEIDNFNDERATLLMSSKKNFWFALQLKIVTMKLFVMSRSHAEEISVINSSFISSACGEIILTCSRNEQWNWGIIYIWTRAAIGQGLKCIKDWRKKKKWSRVDDGVEVRDNVYHYLNHYLFRFFLLLL